jgi:membrane protein DedA with SNARE-associated domain
MKVVTILSGLVSFDLTLFILSAIVARGGRFFLLAWVLQRYGKPMAEFIERRFTLIAGGLLAALAVIWVTVKFI